MNKAELIVAIAEGAELSKQQAGAALDAFTDTVKAELKSEGGKVALVSFGTFSSKKRAARIGRNPSTGESLKIKAKVVVKFKPSKDII